MERGVRHALEGEESAEIVFRSLSSAECYGFLIGRHRGIALTGQLSSDTEPYPDWELIGLALDELFQRFRGAGVVLTSRLRVGASQKGIGRGGCEWCLSVQARPRSYAGEDEN